MTRVIEVAVEPLTASSFAAFGEVIDEFDASVGREKGMKPMRRLEFAVEGTTELYVIRYDQREMRFSMMERHREVTESRVPLTPVPVVMVVAPSAADGEPDLDSMRAFLMNGRQGLVLARDAWHALDCYPVGAPFADFALISEARTERELAELEDLTRCRHSDVVDLGESRGVEVRVLEPDAAPMPG